MGSPVRNDLAIHYFLGAQTWVLDAIHALDTSYLLWDTPAYMDPALIDLAQSLNTTMLEAASDLETTIENDQLKVRIINQSGQCL